MATFFSNQTVGTWSGYTMTGTLTGNVGRSGNTVTLSSLSCTFKAASAWGTDGGYWSAIYNGNTQLTRSNGLSMSNGTGTKSYSNVSITVGASDTSHQFNFRTSDGKTVYFTVTFPSGQIAPATPTISAVLNADETVSVTWGTTNLGNPTGTVYLYNGTTSSPANQISSKTTTGNSTYNNTGLTANTTYYYKATASNTVGSASSSVVSATTYPAGIISFAVDSVTSDSVTVTVVYGASGNALTTAAGCRINGSGTWDTIDTDMQGTTKTYTLGPFLPETTNTVEIRVETTAGNSSAASVTFTTPPPVKLYGSAPSSIAVNSYSLGTEEIITAFGSADFETYAIADYPDIIRKDVSGLRFDYGMSDQSITITALFKDGTSEQLYSGTLLLGTVKATRLGCDGVADLIATPPSSDLTDIVALDTTVSYATKAIKKFYGSVNGQTKTIKKVYASVNGQTKLIYRG